MGNYRDEVFRLAKKFSSCPFSAELINMRKAVSEPDTEMIIGKKIDPKRFIFSSVREHQTHFFGVLLVNSEIENGKVKDLMFKEAEPFNTSEKEIYFKGHQILVDIYNSLVSKLTFLPLGFRLALGPYAGLRMIDPKCILQVDRVFDTSEYKCLADSFESMSLVSNVREKFIEVGPQLPNIKFEDLVIMLEQIKEEVYNYSFREYPEKMGSISIERLQKVFTIEEKTLDFFYSIFCLKESILVTLSTLFSSLIGNDLGIINEDNIIRVVDVFSNPVKKGKVFLITSESKNELPHIGGTTLAVYGEDSNSKVHEFGVPFSIRYSSTEELGETIKVSILIIDECMNPFFSYIY
ncbi:hypothetical protein IGI65_000398 [Enterococcus sp. DIV0755b]|uniref:hypothetical protein n=1 Tax=Enterococcus sp. DIV0755b TaxID=2774657 RepID=UPI003F2227BB